MKHLLQISLGPVQGFIAASRKTRDLAVGSALLAELSREAAAELEGHGAKLIFPPDASQPAANILLATLDGDPRAVAEQAKAKVLERLKKEVARAADKAGILVDKTVDLGDQAEKLLEWFSAWAPIAEDAGGFKKARDRVGALMAGRKATRDFPNAPQDDGRPKSPLDPSFPGVLRLDDGWAVCRGTDTRVKPREHLDAVGLVKRFSDTLADANLRNKSTRTVALAFFLNPKPEEALDDRGRQKLDTRKALLTQLKNGIEPYKEILDIGEALFEETDDLPPDTRKKVEELVRQLAKTGSLRPYYCVLHGDGDAMGKLLDHLSKEGEDALRSFSVALSGFASQVPDIVRRHQGVCVYAGGDDVVALAPMDTAVELAQAIRQAFDATMTNWAKGLTAEPDDLPTFTIGVAAVHVLDNLQEAVHIAQQLEKRGKTEAFASGKKKNALVVGAKPRSGAAISVAGRWDEEFAESFVAHRDHLKEGRLPRGFPYEMRALAQELADFVTSDPAGKATADKLAGKEVARILQKKQADATYRPPDIRSVDALKGYADMLLVAHFFTREGE